MSEVYKPCLIQDRSYLIWEHIQVWAGGGMFCFVSLWTDSSRRSAAVSVRGFSPGPTVSSWNIWICVKLQRRVSLAQVCVCVCGPLLWKPLLLSGPFKRGHKWCHIKEEALVCVKMKTNEPKWLTEQLISLTNSPSVISFITMQIRTEIHALQFRILQFNHCCCCKTEAARFSWMNECDTHMKTSWLTAHLQAAFMQTISCVTESLSGFCLLFALANNQNKIHVNLL